ncbi:hypothetical protein CWS72_26005 [Telmatospirillum siberiense]|uniref:Type II secretion system protein GspH n=2 Tax=Telmatospirillum siberiense TaxID=382514 RepID=A0A2N3PMD1_9PROT|nr:hypothetical protein CWS72_26005 [Telmatospirillum siberiense]
MLEALVALAIAGLIALIVYPLPERAIRAVDVRAGAQALSIDLRRARSLALRSGAPASLLPTRDGHGYVLPDGVVRHLPEGTVISGAGTRFFADGTASGGLFVVAGATRSLGVAVESATGAVTMVVP